MKSEEAADEELETGAAPPPWPGAEAPGVVAVPDFSRREFELRELLDEPCTYAEYRAAMLDLVQVHRLTRGYGPALEFLARAVKRTGVTQEPLHVVDVGCGCGDGLREMLRWAAKRSVPLRLTGVDVNPYAARLAKECDRNEHVGAKRISWVTGDLFSAELERAPDVIVSSLLGHHLSDADIVRYLRWCEGTAQVGWFMSDLRRSERASKVFGWMARVMPWHRMIAADGVVSFRRALTVEEWRLRVAEAEVDGIVSDVGWGRVAVERLG